MVRKIKYGRQAAFKGFVIFELSAFRPIDQILIDTLSVDPAANHFEAPFKNFVNSCILSSRKPHP